MSAVIKLPQDFVEENLAGELNSQTRHEVLDGFADATAGSTIANERIARNLVPIPEPSQSRGQSHFSSRTRKNWESPRRFWDRRLVAALPVRPRGKPFPLPEIEIELPLAEMYERVQFVPEPEVEDL